MNNLCAGALLCLALFLISSLSFTVSACTCGVYTDDLCESINPDGDQSVFLAEAVAWHPGSSYWDMDTILLVVIDNLWGDGHEAGDTISIGPFSACDDVPPIPMGFPVLITLSEYPAGDFPDYQYQGCNNDLTYVSNDSLPINSTTTLAYEDFVASFAECMAQRPRMNVPGKIFNWKNGIGVSDLSFQLSGDTISTDSTGEFLYYGPPYENSQLYYELSATSNEELLRGVSTADLIRINQHILGTVRFEHPEQYIAADVNNNQSITTLDMILLRKAILGTATEFPNNTSWRLVKRSYDYPNPTNPWQEPFPEIAKTTILSDVLGFPILSRELELSTAWLTAIKVGDVDGSF